MYLRYEDGTLVSVASEPGDEGQAYGMALDVREVLGSFQDIAVQIGEKLSGIGRQLRDRAESLPAELQIEVGILLEGSAGLPVLPRLMAWVASVWRS